VKLAETFLAILDRVSADLDIVHLKSEVDALAAKHPGLPAREVGRLMITSTARKAAALGAVASLPPGWAALAAAGPELSTLLVLQSRLILGLHLLYGGVPEPQERALEVLAGLASGAGINVGRRLSTKLAAEVVEKLVLRLVGRQATHMVPILGAVAGAALNYAAVRGIGEAALHRVEKLYGPPDVPGKGPAVDVEGRVS
jgi:uncharacterized protein (DUF697 family)